MNPLPPSLKEKRKKEKEPLIGNFRQGRHPPNLIFSFPFYVFCTCLLKSA